MKFVLANWGSRGEIEPCAAVGRELVRRGHDVHLAVPPDLVAFAESVGLAAVAYGSDLNGILHPYRDFWTYFFRNFWRVRKLGTNVARSFRSSYSMQGGGQQDADIAGGRGRPTGQRYELRRRRC